jgi:hypothetical protein
MSGEIELTRAALSTIQEAMSQPKWAVSPIDVFVAGNLVLRLEKEFAEHLDASAIPDDPKAKKAFMNTKVQLILSSREKDTVKKCMEYHINQGNIIPTPHTAMLCNALGLTE